MSRTLVTTSENDLKKVTLNWGRLVASAAMMTLQSDNFVNPHFDV